MIETEGILDSLVEQREGGDLLETAMEIVKAKDEITEQSITMGKRKALLMQGNMGLQSENRQVIVELGGNTALVLSVPLDKDVPEGVRPKGDYFESRVWQINGILERDEKGELTSTVPDGPTFATKIVGERVRRTGGAGTGANYTEAYVDDPTAGVLMVNRSYDDDSGPTGMKEHINAYAKLRLTLDRKEVTPFSAKLQDTLKEKTVTRAMKKEA